MTIRNRNHEKPTIDLNSSDGNVFALIGYARTYGKILGFDKEKIKEVQSKMMSGNYEDAINVFDSEFGDFVDLIK